jgi:hypothetical protein
MQKQMEQQNLHLHGDAVVGMQPGSDDALSRSSGGNIRPRSVLAIRSTQRPGTMRGTQQLVWPSKTPPPMHKFRAIRAENAAAERKAQQLLDLQRPNMKKQQQQRSAFHLIGTGDAIPKQSVSTKFQNPQRSDAFMLRTRTRGQQLDESNFPRGAGIGFGKWHWNHQRAQSQLT